MGTRGRDYTGERRGTLTAVAPTLARAQGAVVWRWICTCGAEVNRKAQSVDAQSTCGGPAHQLDNPNSEDLTGAKFGRLTVTRLAPAAATRVGLRWSCVCDCGRAHVARAKDLKLGTTTSCGCAQRRAGRVGWGPGSSSLTGGERFGRLVTVERLPSTGRQSIRWRCRCDCSAETVTRANLLRSGQTKSCGCLRSEAAKKRGANKVVTRRSEEAEAESPCS